MTRASDTISEAAAILNAQEQTGRPILGRGVLHGFKVGQGWRFMFPIPCA